MCKENLHAKMEKLETQICRCTRQDLEVMPRVALSYSSHEREIIQLFRDQEKYGQLAVFMHNHQTTPSNVREICQIKLHVCMNQYVSLIPRV